MLPKTLSLVICIVSIQRVNIMLVVLFRMAMTMSGLVQCFWSDISTRRWFFCALKWQGELACSFQLIQIFELVELIIETNRRAGVIDLSYNLQATLQSVFETNLLILFMLLAKKPQHASPTNDPHCFEGTAEGCSV